MYRVIVTEDFIDMLYEIPLRHLSVLAHSFVSIEKVDITEENAVPRNGATIMEMLEQVRNQELE